MIWDIMKKNDRSSINPFTGKKHFDIVNDDNFLNVSYVEYNNILNQCQLLDETSEGELLSNVSLKLIDAVEEHLIKINRTDYTSNYYDWEFHLVSDDTINAFCLPGGKILVYSGILSITNNEQSLAFILAHEMAHALLDHGRTRVSIAKAKNTLTTASRLGTIGLSMIGLDGVGSIARTAIDVADIGSEYLAIKPFSRKHELEADKLGMMIVNWAGYNISEIPKFWQKMSEHSSNKHDFFSTHPSDNKRIDAMNKLIIELPNQKNFHNTPVLSEIDNQKTIKENAIFEIQNQIPGKSAIGLTNLNDDIKINDTSSNKFCSQCRAKTINDAKFCSKCGNKLKIELTCNYCEAKIKKEDSFCSQCGNELRN